MNEGGIYLFKQTGKSCFGNSGFANGVPVAIEHIRRNERGEALWLGLRVARNLTAIRAWPDQIEAFPPDLSIEDAEGAVMDAIYGSLSKSKRREEAAPIKPL